MTVCANLAQAVNLIITYIGGEILMACRCAEKGMCQRDLARLAKASGIIGQASGCDSSMNSNLNSGKNMVPISYTSDTEAELYGAIDEVHNEVSGKISGCSSEISAAIQRVQNQYEAYCIEDDIYHAEQAKIGA